MADLTEASYFQTNGKPRRCLRCAHAAHRGLCPCRNGQTAYPCPCTFDAPAHYCNVSDCPGLAWAPSSSAPHPCGRAPAGAGLAALDDGEVSGG